MTPVSVHHSKPKPKNWWPCHHVLKPSQKWPQNLIIWALSLFDTEHVNNHFADENTIFPSTDYVYSWIWPMHLNIVSRDCGNMWTLHKTLSWSDDPGKEDYRRRCSKWSLTNIPPYEQLLICSVSTGTLVSHSNSIHCLFSTSANNSNRNNMNMSMKWIWMWENVIKVVISAFCSLIIRLSLSDSI